MKTGSADLWVISGQISTFYPSTYTFPPKKFQLSGSISFKDLEWSQNKMWCCYIANRFSHGALVPINIAGIGYQISTSYTYWLPIQTGEQKINLCHTPYTLNLLCVMSQVDSVRKVKRFPRFKHRSSYTLLSHEIICVCQAIHYIGPPIMKF